MNKIVTYALLACAAAVINACTSSVQVVDTITTPPINIDTTQPANVWTFRGDSAAFVADILEKYCNGVIDGNFDGTDWTASLYTEVRHDTVYVAKPTIRLVIRRDTVRIPIPKPIIEELARLRENQEKHDWFWFIGYTLAVVAATGVLLFVYFAIRRIMPGINL